MATTKNIIMKQFNGTDYDTLYPKTDVKQVKNLTPSSIGAVAKSGDTMTGQLNVPAFALTNYNAALEIGKNIDFHAAGSTNDYDARLAYDSGALLFRMHGGDYKTMLHTGNLSVLGIARIETGTYVGTGTNGYSLTFNNVPKLVFVWGSGHSPLVWTTGMSKCTLAGGDTYDLDISLSDKTLSWVCNTVVSGENRPYHSLNSEGKTYGYAAFF